MSLPDVPMYNRGTLPFIPLSLSLPSSTLMPSYVSFTALIGIIKHKGIYVAKNKTKKKPPLVSE